MKQYGQPFGSLGRYFAIALAACILFSGVGSLHLRTAAAMQPIAAIPQPSPPSPANVSQPNPTPSEIEETLVPSALQQGKQFYDAGRFAAAIDQWQVAMAEAEKSGDRLAQARTLRYRAMAHQALNQWSAATDVLAAADTLTRQLEPTTAEGGLLRAQLKLTQGSLEVGKGQTQEALIAFRHAEELYQQIGDSNGVMLSQLNQAQTLQSLGFYPRARRLLHELSHNLSRDQDETTAESRFRGRTLRQLSIVLQAVGEPEEADHILQKSQATFEALNLTDELAETLFQRGHMAQAQEDWQSAERFYHRAQTVAEDPNLRLESAAQKLRTVLCNPTNQSVQGPSGKYQRVAIRLMAQLDRLPPSRRRFYTQVHVAQSLLFKTPFSTPSVSLPFARALAQAVNEAHALQDRRSESYLLGQLGTLYERNHQYRDAFELTHRALSLAQSLNADSLIATWQWQTGRILKAQGKTEAAIAPYRQAVYQLQGLRQDLVAMDPEAQFSFRVQAEPVYRQLIQLLLTDVDTLPATEKQARLEQSRQTLEALQLAQVQNFFREACETYETQSIDQIDPQAAVIYSIVLDHRLEVILSLPGQPLQHYGSDLNTTEQQRLFRQLRQSLNPAFPPKMGLDAAQDLYDRLIRPGETLLQQQGIQTLVFVLDDFLRNVPMAVLHDGDRYLVEQYSLALTPGLQLFESTPLSQHRLQLLAGGLTQARQGFSALPGVKQEMRALVEPSPALKTALLLDKDFTQAQLEQRLQSTPFSILHLATHGQFSSRTQDTFLLTWDGRLGVKDLDQWLNPTATRQRSPIELLILSACQTAKGDERATLGLAGLAVRSGARSTLASLWSVEDQSTAVLMTSFYRQFLEQKRSRAEALRQAQLALLQGDYAHPYYWAPFVLVGNWQ